MSDRLAEAWTEEQRTIWHRPHVLVVREVGEPYGPLSTFEFEDYEVEHHADCPTYEADYGDGGKHIEYECGVGQQERECGLRWSLHYSGTAITEPGRYTIEPWTDKTYVWDVGAYEYDGGVAIVEEAS